MQERSIESGQLYMIILAVNSRVALSVSSYAIKPSEMIHIYIYIWEKRSSKGLKTSPRGLSKAFQRPCQRPDNKYKGPHRAFLKTAYIDDIR